MIYRKSEKNDPTKIESIEGNCITAKLALQIFSIMMLIYLAEAFG